MTILAPTRTTRPTWQALAADARARGVTGLRCDTCGHVHGLGMIGRGCNASHPDIDGGTCDGGKLTEVYALPFSDGLGNTRSVRYSTDGRAL